MSTLSFFIKHFFQLQLMCCIVLPLCRSSARWTSRRRCWTPMIPSRNYTSVPSTWRTQSACTCAFPKKGSSNFKWGHPHPTRRLRSHPPRTPQYTHTRTHTRLFLWSLHSWLKVASSWGGLLSLITSFLSSCVSVWSAHSFIWSPFMLMEFSHWSLLAVSLPGHSMPKRTKQGDDQRRRLLDNHQHRQGWIHFLRGHGPRPLTCHPCACGGELTGTNISIRALGRLPQNTLYKPLSVCSWTAAVTSPCWSWRDRTSRRTCEFGLVTWRQRPCTG